MNKEKIKIELGPLQETLLIPLLARAKETEKESPLLIDPLAGEIVDRIDYEEKRGGSFRYAQVVPEETGTGINKKVLRDMKIADFLKMYRMIHCKLVKNP